jgi:DNA mismatch repair protein MutS
MSEPTTPLMRQYQAIKTRYPHALVLFRLGDFYELFHEDAIVASKELQITLTARNREKGKPIPMCGVPYHAAENYIVRLIRAGFKVAMCDQMEVASPGKKLVRREVTRVITPGTATDAHLLEPRENNFLASVAYAPKGGRVGLAWVDISTGEFSATEFGGAGAEEKLRDELQLLRPREILLERVTGLFADSDATGPGAKFAARMEVRDGAITRLEGWIFSEDYGERMLTEQFGVAGLEGFGLDSHAAAASAAGGVIHYLRETSVVGQNNGASAHVLPSLDRIRYYEQQEALGIDSVSVRNLELVAQVSQDDAALGRATTLLGCLDETATGMGARLLRSWILRPELSAEEIEQRLDAVTALKAHTVLREEIKETLSGVLDLERLTSRITLGLATPRDLAALRASLLRVPLARGFLATSVTARLAALREQMDDLTDVAERISNTLSDDPPAQATEPGVIRRGFLAELDELRDLGQRGRQFIAGMEDRERKRTGIGSLKIRYNQVFGYYIEISHANHQAVPPDYERKQTLANAERYTVPELKEYERKVLEADGRIAEIERRLFAELREWVAVQAPRLRRTAAAIAQLDVLVNFSRLAADRNYARPEFTEDGEMTVVGGRHPVIEQLLEARGERFVPNDLYLNDSTQQILLITGPNMGGKSTYLRQAALIVIMAQIGSFVPATQARLPITDRIYTRIGASDNLARGRSTFLVEMSEVAAILNTATPTSLILLDEVGRGTATFDGLSIAWAVVEHLQSNTRARTLFATHYHELTELAELFSGVKNIHVAVRETPTGIVFLKRVETGSANRSYGIEVARLAGLPPSVVERAREILRRHETSEHELTEKLSPGAAHGFTPAQQPMFTPIDREVLDALRAADLDNLKPLDALNLLAQLKKQIK